jgi:hypothetical protein
MIIVVACVGRAVRDSSIVLTAQNNPLLLNVFTDTAEPLKFHYIIHTSLDLIEERCQLQVTDQFVGQLFPMEEYKLLTSSRPI